MTHYLGTNRLWVLVLADDAQQMRGIAPLYIRRIRVHSPVSVQEIAFLGTEEVGSSHLDVIAERKYKQTVLQRLYDFLFHEAVHEWIS